MQEHACFTRSLVNAMARRICIPANAASGWGPELCPRLLDGMPLDGEGAIIPHMADLEHCGIGADTGTMFCDLLAVPDRDGDDCGDATASMVLRREPWRFNANVTPDCRTR